MAKPKCDGCGGPFPAHKHLCAECVCKMAPGRLGKVLWWLTKRLVQAGAACPECKTLLVVSKPFGEWWP